MPDAGDGFTVISAMRHSQPAALTMLLSAFPDVDSAMKTIILEADEILVKPVEIKRLAEIIRERLLVRRPANRTKRESVGAILQRCSDVVVTSWLERAKRSQELNHLEHKDIERTGYLPKLIEDLVFRLNRSVAVSPLVSDSAHSDAAARPDGQTEINGEREEDAGLQTAGREGRISGVFVRPV